MKEPVDIRIVEDRTDDTRCDEGFLRVRRFIVQNEYADGTTSERYPCDVVSRRQPDAVAVLVYEVNEDRQVHVALRSGVRPPVYLRKHKQFVQPDARAYVLLTEMVAGLLEPDDEGPGGLGRRAAAECLEEAGIRVDPDDTVELGAPMFPTPGITDEKVFYRAVESPLADRVEPESDGSIMEEAGEVVILPIDEAVRRCRSGEMPDSKTEVALLRLCDLIGYSVQLGRFLDELPDDVRPKPERGSWLLGN